MIANVRSVTFVEMGRTMRYSIKVCNAPLYSLHREKRTMIRNIRVTLTLRNLKSVYTLRFITFLDRLVDL